MRRAANCAVSHGISACGKRGERKGEVYWSQKEISGTHDYIRTRRAGDSVLSTSKRQIVFLIGRSLSGMICCDGIGTEYQWNEEISGRWRDVDCRV